MTAEKEKVGLVLSPSVLFPDLKFPREWKKWSGEWDCLGIDDYSLLGILWDFECFMWQIYFLSFSRWGRRISIPTRALSHITGDDGRREEYNSSSTLFPQWQVGTEIWQNVCTISWHSKMGVLLKRPVQPIIPLWRWHDILPFSNCQGSQEHLIKTYSRTPCGCLAVYSLRVENFQILAFSYQYQV